MVTTSSSDDPVEMVVEILSADLTEYTLDPPDIFRMWDLDPQQRLKNPDPAVYVWSPTPGSEDRFSADGSLLTDSRTVECMIMTYDEAKTHRYAEDIIDILGNYIDDNANLTLFEDVDPSVPSDERGEHIFGESNHYIMTVELDTQRLRFTGQIEDATFDFVFSGGFA